MEPISAVIISMIAMFVIINLMVTLKKPGLMIVKSNASLLTEQEYTHYEKAITQQPVTPTIAEAAFGSDFVGPIGHKYVYERIVAADMSVAHLDMEFSHEDGAIQKTSTPVKMPIIQKTFTITWRELEASRESEYESLDVSESKNAREMVSRLEEATLMVGTEEFNGLYNGAAGATASGGLWNVFGNARAHVAAVRTVLTNRRFYAPYDLFLAPDVYTDLMTSEQFGTLEVDQVKLMLGEGGNIYECISLAAGTALMGAKGRGYYKRLVGIGLGLKEENIVNNATRFWVYTISRADIPLPNALQRMTGC